MGRNFSLSDFATLAAIEGSLLFLRLLRLPEGV